MIDSIPVFGRLILAPMDGISDPPFRYITRKLGSALSISEFVNTLDYVNQKHYQRSRLAFKADERPFGVQILDNDPIRMAECAAAIEAEYKPDFFDINLGCSAKSVAGRRAGVGMMRNPETVKHVLREVRKAVSVPITAKMRLGWDEDELNYHEIAEICVENGACAIALHARTAKMAYRGHAYWPAIAELKQLLPVPVIGNGDIQTLADAARMLAETGCDAVMVGRGARDNPWIFSGQNRADVPPARVYALIRHQYKSMLPYYPKGAIMPFRKFLKAYLQPYALPKEVLHPMLGCSDEDKLFAMIQAVFSDLGVNFPPSNEA